MSAISIADVAPARRERARDLAFPVSLVLTTASFACLAAGLFASSFRLTDYGIVSSFPPIYFFGLCLLPLASSVLWLRDRPAFPLILVQLFALIAVLWLSPYILSQQPYFRTAFKNYGYVDPFVRGAGFDRVHLMYHNWPLFPLLFAGVVKATHVTPIELILFFPIAIELLYLPALIILFRTLFPDSTNRWWIGVWLFYLFNWTSQDYFSPQGLAYLFFLWLLVIIAWSITRRAGRLNVWETTLFLLLFTAIVLTHVLTALMAIGVLAVFTLTGRFRDRQMVLVAAMIFIAWQVFGAADFYRHLGGRALGSILSVDTFLGSNVGARAAGSAGHQFVVRLRMVSAAVAFAVAGIGLLAGRKRFGATASFSIILLLSVSGIALISAYGGEMLIRVLLFSLPALGVMVVPALSRRIPMLAVIAVFAVAAPTHIVTHYGNQRYDYVSSQELDAYNFVANTLAPANIYGLFPAGAFENTEQLDWRSGEFPAPPATVDDYLHPDLHHWRNPKLPIYVGIGRGEDAAYQLFYGDRGFAERVKSALDGQCNFVKVFENGDATIYRWFPTCNPGTLGGLP